MINIANLQIDGPKMITSDSACAILLYEYHEFTKLHNERIRTSIYILNSAIIRS